MYHEFRISISHCPNACSQPQIVDVGLIGACRPEVTGEDCTLCGECLQICRETAISIKQWEKRVWREYSGSWLLIIVFYYRIDHVVIDLNSL